MTSESQGGLHLATVAHDGGLWEVYVEFDEDPRRSEMYRARLRFDAPASVEGDSAFRTAIILIEDSFEEVMARARTFDARQLGGLLRSVLPGEDEEGEAGA